MLKNILFLLLLLTGYQAYAVASSTTAMTEIQRLIKQNQNAAAIGALQQLLKSEATNYQAWFLLGVIQAEQQQFDAAIHAFHQVVALQPSLAEPHNNLAVIYDERGDIKAAVNELEASLTLKPGYLVAQKNLGDLYIKLAANAYKKVLDHSESPILQQRYERLLHLPSNAVGSDLPLTKAANSSPAIEAPTQRVAVLPTAILTPLAASQHQTDASNTNSINISKQAVLAALEAWRMAWSDKNTTAYFAAYSHDFQYNKTYQSLRKWKDYKTWAIQKRSFITINIEHIVATIMHNDDIKLTFLQHFRSDSFNSDDRKEIVFKKTSNGWKIIYEVSM